MMKAQRAAVRVVSKILRGRIDKTLVVLIALALAMSGAIAESFPHCVRTSQPWKDTEAKINNGSFNFKNKCDFPVNVTWCVESPGATKYLCGTAFGGYRLTEVGGSDAQYSFHATKPGSGPLKLHYQVCKGGEYSVSSDGTPYRGHLSKSRCVPDPGFGLDTCSRGGTNCWLYH